MENKENLNPMSEEKMTENTSTASADIVIEETTDVKTPEKIEAKATEEKVEKAEKEAEKVEAEEKKEAKTEKKEEISEEKAIEIEVKEEKNAEIEEKITEIEEKNEEISEIKVVEEKTPEIEEKEEKTPETEEKSPEVETTDEKPVEKELSVEKPEEVKKKVTEKAKDNLPEDVNYENYTKEELLLALKELLDSEYSTSQIKNNVGNIRAKFNEIVKAEREEKKKIEQAEASENKKEDAGEEKDIEPKNAKKEKVEDPLEKEFWELYSVFQKLRAEYIEGLEKEKQENLKKKNVILDQMKETIASNWDNLKECYDKFNGLRESWREIGYVPREEQKELWERYHFCEDQFHEKVKLSRELIDIDLKKNLEAKIEICEKTETLLLESSIVKSFRMLQVFHEKWKEIGRVPTDKKDELWDRFKNATDKINERRRDYYEEIEAQQQQNLLAKTALCEKMDDVMAMEITSIKKYGEITEIVNEMMKLWRSFGPAPKKHNDEIWARFKGMVNQFFENKSKYFGELKAEQNKNYNLKLDLCKRVEALQENIDWKTTTSEIINVQKEWKEIGSLPRKQSDELWKRFRAACDFFFNKKDEHFSGLKGKEAENQKIKEALIEEVGNANFTEDRTANMEMLKEFQRRWTEVGYVARNVKDKLNSDFRAAINIHLDTLKIESYEIAALSYQSRIDKLDSNNPDKTRILSNEKRTLQNSITKLSQDINLWENNMEFLSKSKNADLLRVEFEKKITKAKEELALLKGKLKFINIQMK